MIRTNQDTVMAAKQIQASIQEKHARDMTLEEYYGERAALGLSRGSMMVNVDSNGNVSAK